LKKTKQTKLSVLKPTTNSGKDIAVHKFNKILFAMIAAKINHENNDHGNKIG